MSDRLVNMQAAVLFLPVKFYFPVAYRLAGSGKYLQPQYSNAVGTILGHSSLNKKNASKILTV